MNGAIPLKLSKLRSGNPGLCLEPAADEAQALVDFMRDRGVLMSTDGPLHNVIKIKPPMVLNEEDVEITLSLLDEGLTSL